MKLYVTAVYLYLVALLNTNTSLDTCADCDLLALKILGFSASFVFWVIFGWHFWSLRGFSPACLRAN